MIYPLLSTLLLTMFSTAIAAQVHAAPADPEAALRVGVHYVVPPFVGGSKVRTPDTIDTTLATLLADQLKTTVTMVAATSTDTRPDVVLTTVPDVAATSAVATTVTTGYVARPMAIMRTDTDIKSWKDLKGRTVCLAEGGRYVGAMARDYDAIEIVHRAPADSLLALRIGGCDAAVHDQALLNGLLRLPEWKKFSSRLPAGAATPLVFTIPNGDPKTVALLTRLRDDWQSRDELAKITDARARDIAFEVYLDQVVADCH